MLSTSEWSNVGGGGNSFSTKIAFLPTSEEAIVRPSTYTNNSDEVYISGNGKVILVNVTDDMSNDASRIVAIAKGAGSNRPVYIYS